MGIQRGVWSKNSCGFTLVVFEEAPKPFVTANRTFTFCALTDRRKEQHVALALMISLIELVASFLSPRRFAPGPRWKARGSYEGGAVRKMRKISSHNVGQECA